jgi:hypothetical protein
MSDNLINAGTPQQLTYTSMSFFGVGELLKWMSEPHSWASINGPLSTLSFLVSITVGVIGILVHLRKLSNNRKSKS